MQAINFIEIETKSGYRSFELHCDDITGLEFDVDLLVISAFSKSYEPIPGTVIGALYDRGINVEELVENCMFDFRETFGGWISREINESTFKQILCIEMKGTDFVLEETIKNLFTVLSIIEIGRLQIRSIALPLIGTGNQKFDPTNVVSTLIDQAIDFLHHARYLEKIVFVEYNDVKATTLSDAMDRQLGRSKVRVPKGPLVDGIKQEILGEIEKLISIIGTNEILTDLRGVISKGQCKSFELGGVSRRIVEFIAQDLTPAKKEFELMKKIDSLSSVGIAQWIVGYMQVMRVFGNEAVHEIKKDNRDPRFVDEKDLELCLFCIQRVLNFYFNHKNKV